MENTILKNKLRSPISLRWIIPENQLNDMKDVPGKYLHSEAFDASNLDYCQYWIEIHHLNHDLHSGESRIYLFFDNDGDETKIEADFNISIESANFFSSKKYAFQGRDAAEIKFFSFKELFNPEKEFFVDGAMTIIMEGILSFEKDGDDIHMWKHGTSDDLLGLGLWEQDNKEFTVVGADGKEIAAHKNVLAARSPVFANMFKSGMTESKENKVIIEDFSFNVVEKAIKLCYHQSLVRHTTLEEKTKLLQFFDKYDIQQLKDDLEKHLIYIIDVSNVCHLTNAALISNAPKLEKNCAEFLWCSLNERSPICDFDMLDKEFALKMFKNVFCHVSA